MNLQLEVYQWLGPIIACYFIVRTFKQYKNGKYSPRNTIIWISFWFGVLLLSLLPDKVPNLIARSLGFKDHINAIIFAALALLFLMVFYLSAAVNRVENKLTTLVRKIALENTLFQTSTVNGETVTNNNSNYIASKSNSSDSNQNIKSSKKIKYKNKKGHYKSGRKSKRLSKS